MELILASGSPYRARVLREAGYRVQVDPPDIDERSLDHLFGEQGAAVLAVELAQRKAMAVLPRHTGVVVAGDQVGVLRTPAGERMLTKTPDAETAVEQLMAMSGTRHELLNGLAVALKDADGTTTAVTGVDVQVIHMTRYDEQTARAYVQQHRPFDTAGSYRLEDDAGLVDSVAGEDLSGVLGMPLPLLERLLDELDARTASSG